MTKLNKPYSRPDYVDFASIANNQNMKIIDMGQYLELVPKEQEKPTYSEKRISEYPKISEQLDMIYWDKINGTNIWSEKITEIKNKYPKK